MRVKTFPEKVKINPDAEIYLVVKLRTLATIFLVKIVQVKKFPDKVKINPETETYLVVKFRILTL